MKNKKIQIGLSMILILLIIFFIYKSTDIVDNKKINNKNNFTQEEQNNEEIYGNKNIKDKIILSEKTGEQLIKDLSKMGVNFPINNTKSYSIIGVGGVETGVYENVAKEKESRIVLEFSKNNFNGGISNSNGEINQLQEIKSVIIKKLTMNNENLFYVLKTYTDYSENNPINTKISYNFKPNDKNKFLWEEEKITAGEIFITEDGKITVIASVNQEDLDLFLVKFKEENEIKIDFFTYLNNNQNFINRINVAYEKQNQDIATAMAKVPQSIQNFGLNFWDNYILLNNNLGDFYASKVWMYMDYAEWFEDADMFSHTEKKFISLDSTKLIGAYKDVKGEEFADEIDEIKELKKDIKFYYAKDVMNICSGENKVTFYDKFHAKEDDVMMFVRAGMGNLNICTLEGKFNFDDNLLWVIRNINGQNKIVIDYTE